MKQTALNTVQNPEKESWELFEVGSYEEVIQLSVNSPGNLLLNHLACLAHFEKGNTPDTVGVSILKGSTVFTPLIQAYQSYFKGDFKSASKKIREYFQNPGHLLCYSLCNFSIKTSLTAGDTDTAYLIIKKYEKSEKENPFILEEMDVLFSMQKYHELIELFRQAFRKVQKEYEIHRKIGLALYYLGRYKEAEAILEKIPGKPVLPTFEEKKKDYEKLISMIPVMEKKKDKTPEEISELGYAYLFNSEFKKAETTFVHLLSLVK